MVERCRQRRVLHKHQSRLKADLREEPYRTQIQYYAAAQWEDNQLDNDESGNLFQLLISLMQLWGQKGEENDLNDEQLLANGSPHSSFRGFYSAHSQNVHVNRQADPDQEVAVNDRKCLFDWSTSQAHASPPVCNAISSIADLLTEGREIWLDRSSERTVETLVHE